MEYYSYNKDIVYLTMEYYSIQQWNKCPLKQWMDVEIVILIEVSQRKTNIIVELICGILKNNTNKLIYKTETDSQKQEINLWLPKEKWGGEEIN